jgi:hypothetical protein
MRQLTKVHARNSRDGDQGIRCWRYVTVHLVFQSACHAHEVAECLQSMHLLHVNVVLYMLN